MKPTLYIVIPCYNEEKVLPITAPLFLDQLSAMTKNVIALFIYRFKNLITIGNSTHNFYKKCDTNITLKL